MPKVVADFIIDFQSTDFEHDANIARNVLSDYSKTFSLKDGSPSFVLEPAKRKSAGWSFGKLYLSLEFVQKLYDNNINTIKRSKGRHLEDRFIRWLNLVLQERGCNKSLVLKAADDMRDFGRFTQGRPIGFSSQ